MVSDSYRLVALRRSGGAVCIHVWWNDLSSRVVVPIRNPRLNATIHHNASAPRLNAAGASMRAS